MTLRKKNNPFKTSAGIVFDVYDVGGAVYRVEVTEEAIEDFCDPRGIKLEGDDLPAALLEAILLAADKLVQRAPAGIKSVMVDKKALNG
ncbi:hypothetical protein [Rhizobium herbae]|uniref:DUF1488 family protein n=1 Tax=Rhizobium herbae TaxID=508661 RepID=A0ABS4EFY8_9HYPH|nr:hypothetical protein [Rhizobium herbae]MBP1856849.1 hypothetical protein [Rhizobium herbae]